MIKIRSSQPFFRRNHTNPKALELLVHAEGVELTPALIEAIQQKIGRVQKYAPQALGARVRLQKLSTISPSQQFRAQVVYELPGQDIAASQKAHEALAAIDLVAEKVERRLRKRKTAALASRLRWQRRHNASLTEKGLKGGTL